MKGFRDVARDNECGGEKGNSDEALAVLRGIDLLPHQQRKPCLEDVGRLVHGRDDDGSLFVVGGANLVGPAVGDGIGVSWIRLMMMMMRQVRCTDATQRPDRPKPAPARM